MTISQVFECLEKAVIFVENHGISIVVTVGVLFYMFRLSNLFYIKLEKKIINNHSKNLKEKRPITIEKNGIIHQLLYKALYEYKGDRAYIFEYHNGGHSISGIDFLKCSNTFEVVNESVTQKQNGLQNLPIGGFAYWNMKILKRETICIKDIEELKGADLGIYHVLKQQDIKSIFVIGLYDAQGHPIGFFGIDYTQKPLIDCDQQMKKDLEILSYKIAGLLY